ncbi:ATP-binding protein [Paenibacillus melissococcoides]|uniref:ATP-binding protein n=1 Tax=Paenibacillus melissococcoides TaxID=2912268 RepID=A0ABN8UEY3_9BACL|nr:MULTISPECIES: AAA family ATPase [Paenibacillus]MEB9892947.1 AAA family ATPase [Bacillus cereus]CAH8249684.1 ATP-binding protein [Paenibacillus melissococcoides]CAH8721529.1 ATP-binding protein [Paenibacillus melissococcoides]CAH8721690.1 ATP-binding protein [Paenibacillus melissococcoides]GIO81225.1 hypothetical protein J6TS7_48350 [Paenibacillus dendritiformis]
MSAGEQRIFKILTEVYNAPKYSLILIDEIDLLLHSFALKRMIKVLYERAKEKHLQIVFTTHSPNILSEHEMINIRHLYNTPEKTLCFSDTKPDTIYRMTGEQEKPLEIFVEDDLAQTIVEHVADSLNLSKYVNTTRYGAAINCFSVAAGLALSNRLNADCLFVLDGDEYNTDDSKKDRIKAVLTGNTEHSDKMRREVLSRITQFNLPEGFSPERYIHSLLKELRDIYAQNQIIGCAIEIQKVDNKHKYVDEILDRIGFINRAVGLSKVVELVSNHENWDDFISPIKEWLNSIAHKVLEDHIKVS